MGRTSNMSFRALPPIRKGESLPPTFNRRREVTFLPALAGLVSYSSPTGIISNLNSITMKPIRQSQPAIKMNRTKKKLTENFTAINENDLQPFVRQPPILTVVPNGKSLRPRYDSTEITAQIQKLKETNYARWKPRSVNKPDPIRRIESVHLPRMELDSDSSISHISQTKRRLLNSLNRSPLSLQTKMITPSVAAAGSLCSESLRRLNNLSRLDTQSVNDRVSDWLLGVNVGFAPA